MARSKSQVHGMVGHVVGLLLSLLSSRSAPEDYSWHVLIPLGIKPFYWICLRRVCVHEVLVLPRTVKRVPYAKCVTAATTSPSRCATLSTRGFGSVLGPEPGFCQWGSSSAQRRRTTMWSTSSLSVRDHPVFRIPGSCTRVTQTMNSRTLNSGRFYEPFPRFMLRVAFNAPLEYCTSQQAVLQMVGDARPPLTGEPVKACLAPSPVSVPPAQKSPSVEVALRGWKVG